MDGIQRLGKFSKLDDGLQYVKPSDERLVVTQITSTAEGSDYKTSHIRSGDVRSFLEDDVRSESCLPQAAGHVVKLIEVTSQVPGTIDLDYELCNEILTQIGIEPWIGRLFRNWTYGYHYSTRDTGARSGSYYLGTGHFTAMWTTTNRVRSSGVTKGVIVAQRNNRRDIAGAHIYDRIVDRLEVFNAVSWSPLYLPFVLSVDILTVRETINTDIFSTIRKIEIITGHGSWGHVLGDMMRNQDGIKHCTSELGRALNQLADIYKHLNMVDLIFKDIDAQAAGLSTSDADEHARSSTSSIAEAIGILRQQSIQLRDQAQYLEVRVRSQSSVLFSLLTHQDAQVNIRTASASVQLAEVARRDGSSMKTVAVLTMAFLPATFFAAFFSIPSVHWTDFNMFALYWACTLPVTVGTFILWAGITQRSAVRAGIAELSRFVQEGRSGNAVSPREST